MADSLFLTLPCPADLTEIDDALRMLADADYRRFQSGLLPGINPARVLGVRMPVLHRYARAIVGTPAAAAFLADLPHASYDADNLHACLLSMMDNRTALICALDAFLPHIDNWATCDMLRPPLLGRDLPALRRDAARWMADPHPYTCRFGIEMLMVHGLGKFSADDPAAVAEIAWARGDEYYVAMMCAWYFATALAAAHDAIWPYFAEPLLPPAVRQMARRKAYDSRRISPADKAALRAMPANFC